MVAGEEDEEPAATDVLAPADRGRRGSTKAGENGAKLEEGRAGDESSRLAQASRKVRHDGECDSEGLEHVPSWRTIKGGAEKVDSTTFSNAEPSTVKLSLSSMGSQPGDEAQRQLQDDLNRRLHATAEGNRMNDVSRSEANPKRNTDCDSSYRIRLPSLEEDGCVVIDGLVYNANGYAICGILNQHDKPCQRIGKCPFHPNAELRKTALAQVGRPDEVSSGAEESDQRGNGEQPDRPPPRVPYKRGWSKEEHFLFLKGLEEYGRGAWKEIAKVVKSRNPTQIQSHAQKYFLRQQQGSKNKRSIHDLTLESPEMRGRLPPRAEAVKVPRCGAGQQDSLVMKTDVKGRATVRTGGRSVSEEKSSEEDVEGKIRPDNRGSGLGPPGIENPSAEPTARIPPRSLGQQGGQPPTVAYSVAPHYFHSPMVQLVGVPGATNISGQYPSEPMSYAYPVLMPRGYPILSVPAIHPGFFYSEAPTPPAMKPVQILPAPGRVANQRQRGSAHAEESSNGKASDRSQIQS